MSMDKYSLIEYIFNNENLDFIVDIDNKQVAVKDYDEVNEGLFNEVKELKKQIFNMFIKGEDLALNRIKNRLLQSKESLASADFGINIDVESHGFSCVIEPESLKEINDLKIQYIDELVEVINN